ncbi:MAG: hypothetical protein AAF687_08185, partial [Pseudomonadota bacterium]
MKTSFPTGLSRFDPKLSSLTLDPLALSLLKPVLSGCCKQAAEGGCPYFPAHCQKKKQSFDKLRMSGFMAENKLPDLNLIRDRDADLPEETRWEGRFI